MFLLLLLVLGKAQDFENEIHDMGETSGLEALRRNLGTDVLRVDVSDAFLGYENKTPECGVCSQDDLAGEGYLMYTRYSWWSTTDTRFSHVNQGNYARIQNVRYTDEKGWEYDTNTEWKSFVPKHSDVLIAKVNYSSDTCTILDNHGSQSYHSIKLGYSSGDLECRANSRYANAGTNVNNGEFYVQGTYFEYISYYCSEEAGQEHVPLAKSCVCSSTSDECPSGKYYYDGGCHDNPKPSPTWIYKGPGVCPDDEHRGMQATGHTIDSCRSKCEPTIEAYFSMWEDNGVEYCGCFRDCDSLTLKGNGETYEIVSTNTQNYINQLIADMQPEFSSRDQKIQDLEDDVTALTSQKNLWKTRFEDIQSMETAQYLSNKALENNPGQEAAVGDSMINCTPQGSKMFDRMLFAIIGMLAISMVHYGFCRIRNKEGDTYNMMMEL